LNSFLEGGKYRELKPISKCDPFASGKEGEGGQWYEKW
jgi:hypothetical protein